MIFYSCLLAITSFAFVFFTIRFTSATLLKCCWLTAASLLFSSRRVLNSYLVLDFCCIMKVALDETHIFVMANA
ncbi:hypothetical protein EDC96DRAFT_498702 [Choanephora cucurbitarum]|nr:hypothetical protein EDC96DRAFT_498702 [Choanephora cucurbitarum]